MLLPPLPLMAGFHTGSADLDQCALVGAFSAHQQPKDTSTKMWMKKSVEIAHVSIDSVGPTAGRANYSSLPLLVFCSRVDQLLYWGAWGRDAGTCIHV